MSSSDFLLEVYQKLTGTTPPSKGDYWSPALPSSPFAGFNLIYSGDRVPERNAERAYPYIVMEIGEIVPTDRQYVKNATIYFSIGMIVSVEGSLQAIQKAASDFAVWLNSTKFDSAIRCYPQSISFTVGERGTQYTTKRYADIAANVIVTERW